MEQTIDKILHKEFDQKMRGYNCDSVDDFLDEVVEDIEKLQTKYNLLLDEKKILEKNNFELKMKMLDIKEKMSNRDLASQTSLLGETKHIDSQVNQMLGNPTTNLQIRKENQQLGKPITHEDSKAEDHTLQDRIEQLERELNNIKNFTE